MYSINLWENFPGLMGHYAASSIVTIIDRAFVNLQQFIHGSFNFNSVGGLFQYMGDTSTASSSTTSTQRIPPGGTTTFTNISFTTSIGTFRFCVGLYTRTSSSHNLVKAWHGVNLYTGAGTAISSTKWCTGSSIQGGGLPPGEYYLGVFGDKISRETSVNPTNSLIETRSIYQNVSGVLLGVFCNAGGPSNLFALRGDDIGLGATVTSVPSSFVLSVGGTSAVIPYIVLSA